MYRYVGEKIKEEISRYLLPDSDIGNGLTTDFVLSQLNTKHCFDFDYQPNQGDNLIINDSGYESRLEFIFLNNKWTENHYNPFDDECEMVVKGFLKKP